MSASNKIETASHITTIGVAVLISAVLIKVYLIPVSAPQVASAERGIIAVGTDLKGRVPGVDWKKNGRIPVLAISTNCHFCKDSEPFYRRLKQEVGSGLKTVDVLPQSVSESEQYLRGAGLQVDQVKQVTLADVGIRGTPTVLLVNGRGVVTGVWTGRLQPQQEGQLVSFIRKG